MNAALPKQFIKIGGKSVLMHTIRNFYRALDFKQILVTLPEGFHTYWQKLCDEAEFTIPHTVITGGKKRFHSVQKALGYLQAEEGVVGIHDGVRPFSGSDLIQTIFKAAETHKAAIPVIPIKDSVRIKEGSRWIVKDRSELRKVQTPQVFDLKLLRVAYEYAGRFPGKEFTDDASVWEKRYEDVKLVDGNERNIKITDNLDLKFADFLLQSDEIK